MLQCATVIYSKSGGTKSGELNTPSVIASLSETIPSLFSTHNSIIVRSRARLTCRAPVPIARVTQRRSPCQRPHTGQPQIPRTSPLLRRSSPSLHPSLGLAGLEPQAHLPGGICLPSFYTSRL